jgi:REP element-mobilizing transposase RayT
MKQLSLIKKRKRTPGVKWGRPVTTGTGARQKRQAFSSRHPLHITLRLREGLPNLRSQEGSKIVQHALRGLQKNGVRVIHFAILSNHIHLIVEAKSAEWLFAGMKSFLARLGIQLRKWASVATINRLDMLGLGLFVGRYDIQILKTPRQVRNALKYVLLNPAKHFRKAPYVDMFTPGSIVDSWKELVGQQLRAPAHSRVLRERLKSFLSPPELWLTREGWERAGI